MSGFPLLPRKKNTDKSHYGHVLVLAGSKGMTGAALLTSRAALESGAGLVTLAVPEGLQAFFSRKAIPEMMVRNLKTVRLFLKKRKVSCIALGPGLSLDLNAQKFVRSIVKEAQVPVVLDADGLNSFKGRARELLNHPAVLVMTPHAGEFERVFSKELPQNLQERQRLGKKISKLYDAVLVLKGHCTLVVYRDEVYVSHTGNPGMAKGGAGDVLTGILASFIAQGLTPFQAARWAVYFHGKAGDLAAREKGELGLLASDIIRYLPAAFKSRASL